MNSGESKVRKWVGSEPSSVTYLKKGDVSCHSLDDGDMHIWYCAIFGIVPYLVLYHIWRYSIFCIVERVILIGIVLTNRKMKP